MINLDTRQATEVDWPGYPPLIETDRGPIYQLLRWSVSGQVWVKLVRRKSSVAEPGIVELDAEEFLEGFLAGSSGKSGRLLDFLPPR